MYGCRLDTAAEIVFFLAVLMQKLIRFTMLAFSCVFDILNVQLFVSIGRVFLFVFAESFAFENNNRPK